MDELDLHGVKHRDAERKIENFLLSHDTPMRVITGNSAVMIRYLQQIAAKHAYEVTPESDFNLGSYIVR